MNRKGDIPITILVIGVVMVCGLALISFYISNLDTNNSFSSISLIEKASIQMEENNFYNNVKEIYLEDIDSKLTWTGFEKILMFSVKYVP